VEILKFAVDHLSYSPDHAQKNEDLNTQWTVQVALTLETIWFLRNQIAHNKGNINLRSTIHGLNLKAQKHLESLNVVDKDKRQGTTCWTCPPKGEVKLNVDAAIYKDYTILAVVARDDQGVIIKVWKKKHIFCDPLQAEAAALLWVLELAVKEKYERIVVEGDAKGCFDALNGDPSNVNWTKDSIICNILTFISLFLSCNFIWMRREANGIVHSMTKYVSSTSFRLFYCSKTSLPRPVLEDWRLDSLSFSC
jgi:hypothetical protein